TTACKIPSMNSKQPLPARRGDFLDRKLIFLKGALRRNPQPPTPTTTDSPPDVAADVAVHQAGAPADLPASVSRKRSQRRSPSPNDAEENFFDDLGSVWQEPPETPHRFRPRVQER